jgi:hypothetical protein
VLLAPSRSPLTFFPRKRARLEIFPASSGTTSLSGVGGLLIWIKAYVERPLGVTSRHFRKAAQCLLSPRADATAPSECLFYPNESITRSIAGCLRFLTSTQCRDLPP